QQVNRWEENEVETYKNNIHFLSGLLQEYLTEQNKRSIKLPSGNVGLRKQRDEWVYDDEIVLKSLETSNLNEYVRIKKEVNKAELKKNVENEGNKVIDKETGEIIEGIQIVERGDALRVKVT